ncbi:MAG: hypothetical protein DCC58_09820 [Chloroflexi bacterium]|nr:MAG: hypothetical protein DCC58_09820 [Chloroflexota bacterium]
MSGMLHCPSCGTELATSARFCPGCGRPRTWVHELLMREAQRSGRPYQELLDELHLADLRSGYARLQALDQRLAQVEALVGIAPAPAPPQQAPPAPEAPVSVAVEPVPTAEAITPPARPEPAPPVGTPAPAPSRPPLDIEALLSGRVLAIVGGLALLVGMVFFLSLAFSRGWIGPTGRVVIGFLAGLALFAGGAWLVDRRERVLGFVLTAVGLGVLSIAFLAATRLYDLVPVWAGLVGVLAVVACAAVVAIRSGSQVIAAFGLVAALAAPPLLGARADAPTVAFLAIVLCGTTAIALYRSWRWLPGIAFFLSGVQVLDFMASDASVAARLLAAAGFWLLNAVAAGGEEFRVRTYRLRVTSTTLLVLNAAMVVGSGMGVLGEQHDEWRGAYLLGVALAHAAIGGYFLKVAGSRHPFGMLACGTGVAVFTMAVPVQAGGSWVAVAWASEAVALTWLYRRLGNPFAAAAALFLGMLAVAHLLLIEYPFFSIAHPDNPGLPFASVDGLTLAYMLGCLVSAGWLLRSRAASGVLAALGVLLWAYALPFEADRVVTIGGCAALSVATTWVTRRFLLDGAHVFGVPPSGTAWYAARAPIAAGWLAGGGAYLYALWLQVPPAGERFHYPATPFTDERTVLFALLSAAAAANGLLAGGRVARQCGVVLAFVTLAVLLPLELRPAALVVGWAVLVAGLWTLARRLPGDAGAYVPAAMVLLALAALVAVLRVAPLSRLTVDAVSSLDHPLFLSGATAALGATALAATFGSWTVRHTVPNLSVALAVAAAALCVYLLSVGVVDAFQVRVGGGRALEELQKQAQVALSILWGVLGGAAFIFGVARRVKVARLFGLLLLAITTVKVFLFDLASLDAAYRVLSFIGLGILLLVSSWFYRRLSPDRIDVPP